ncbi:PRC-barrel domain protein [compost metagenome]
MKDGTQSAALRFDAEVRCLDGRCGRLRRVVLDPRTADVTHLVIRIGDGRDVVMPMAMVGCLTADAITLKVASDELKDLPDYLSTDYCLPTSDITHPYGEGCAILPLPDLGVFNPGPLRIEHHHIPDGEIELKAGIPVLCSDGECGEIDQLLIDPEQERATGFIVRKGFFFTHDVAVPLSWVRALDVDGVHLKASRDQLTKLERNWP